MRSYMDLICLGELLIDMFPAELGRPHAEVSAYRPWPGGAPANVAVAARRLGAEAAFIGKVGDDPFGHFLVDVLAAEGVETRGMRARPRGAHHDEPHGAAGREPLRLPVLPQPRRRHAAAAR